MPMTLLERFNSKWQPVTETGCWIWDAAISKEGYGWIKVGGKKGKATGAHRVSYLLFNGEIPKDIHVLHKCDTPACVNPKHLFLGTNKDNVEDRVRKGRTKAPGCPGERHWNAKLTKEQVNEIKLLRKEGKKLNEIAEFYGVSFKQVSKICLGQRWTSKRGV